MPQLTAYLSFDGNCAEAMRFYERALGGRLSILMNHAQSPIAAHVPPGNDERILHARLEFDGGVLMAGDSMVGAGPHQPMKGFNVVLNYDRGRAGQAGVRGALRGRQHDHAVQRGLLGRRVRHVHRPLRHPVDRQRRPAHGMGN